MRLLAKEAEVAAQPHAVRRIGHRFMHGPFAHDDHVAGIERGEDDTLCIVDRTDLDWRQPAVGGSMLPLENHLWGIVGPRVGHHAATC
jgi:hypothetical protein